MNDCHERPGPNGSVLNFDAGYVVHGFTGTVSPALNADGSGNVFNQLTYIDFFVVNVFRISV